MLCCQRSLAITSYEITTSDHPLNPLPLSIPNPHLTRPKTPSKHQPPLLPSAHLSLANHYQTPLALPLSSHAPKSKSRTPNTLYPLPLHHAIYPYSPGPAVTLARVPGRYTSRHLTPLTRTRSRAQSVPCRTFASLMPTGRAFCLDVGGHACFGGKVGVTNQKCDFIYSIS